jgi:hypothetical protein
VIFASGQKDGDGSCAADFNGSGRVDTQDVMDYMNAWFAGETRADFNQSGGVETADVFDFLNAWLAGCAGK